MSFGVVQSMNCKKKPICFYQFYLLNQQPRASQRTFSNVYHLLFATKYQNTHFSNTFKRTKLLSHQKELFLDIARHKHVFLSFTTEIYRLTEQTEFALYMPNARSINSALEDRERTLKENHHSRNKPPILGRGVYQVRKE